MPRKGTISRRPQATDPVYANDLVEKFICTMMWEGKKSTAQRVFYGAMDQVAKKTAGDALTVFKKALENVKPLVEVKTRRVGGANYQVPVEVNPAVARLFLSNIRLALAIWRFRQEQAPKHP